MSEGAKNILPKSKFNPKPKSTKESEKQGTNQLDNLRASNFIQNQI